MYLKKLCNTVVILILLNFCPSLIDGPRNPQLSHTLKGTKTYFTKHRAISQNLVDLRLYSGIRITAGISQHSQQTVNTDTAHILTLEFTILLRNSYF